jgi:hypothetical protein
VRGGEFREDDPNEVVEFVDRKLLNRGVATKVFGGSIEGVRIRPSAAHLDRKQRKAVRELWPRFALYRARLTHGPRCYLWPGTQIALDAAPARLAAAGVTAPCRPTSGGLELGVGDQLTAPEVVALGLTTLKAMGAPGPAWEWEPIEAAAPPSVS